MESKDWDARYEGREPVWSATPDHFLVLAVDGLALGRVLDLGCGEGRNAVWLAEQGWQVTGVDFSVVGIRRGRELAARRGVEVEWVVADLRSYQPARLGFDLVLVFYVHIAPGERERLWRGAAAAVAPGGTLLLVGHDLSNLTEGYGGPHDAQVLFTPADVVAELGDLTVIKAEKARRKVVTEEGEFEAIDAVVRAYRPGS